MTTKLIYSQDQIITQLLTQWDGKDETAAHHDLYGSYRKWVPHDGTVYYSIPTTAPNDEDNDPKKGEDSGFNAAMMTDFKRDMARQAFELWDDLIALNLTETSATDGNIITLAYSSTTLNHHYYTTPFLT